jgi:Fe-S-cluster-containing dehydrogenase component
MGGMQYGFLIDHTRCIGCHACTVACKSENDVPVGNFRTWVKYTEKGVYPSVKRSFAVLRCNHCTNAPCVSICPVNALQKRPDGIVDIDKDACIGCRACMQACPYDAIHLNEDTGAVEKCHFCAHRVERNLAPACAVVCPAQAIIHGDLHDPDSAISKYKEGKETLVRRPEQRTGPNVHYLGVEPLALEPGAAVRLDTFIWSERPPHKTEAWPADLPVHHEARTVLDVAHHVEWGWPVATYLVTKGLGAGAGMLAPFAATLGLTGWAHDFLPEVVGLVFTGATTALLVEDLHRPMKFLTLLTRPNTRSWLVRGAWILIAYTIVLAVALGLRFVDPEVADLLRFAEVPLGIGAAGYTAFLFRQCEGRDLWQGKLVGPALLAQAVALGGAAFTPFAPGAANVAALAFLAFLLLSYAEVRGRHPTTNATQAAAFLRTLQLGGANAFTIYFCLSVLTFVFLPTLPWLALLTMVAAVGVYEWLFVRAG